MVGEVLAFHGLHDPDAGRDSLQAFLCLDDVLIPGFVAVRDKHHVSAP